MKTTAKDIITGIQSNRFVYRTYFSSKIEEFLSANSLLLEDLVVVPHQIIDYGQNIEIDCDTKELDKLKINGSKLLFDVSSEGARYEPELNYDLNVYEYTSEFGKYLKTEEMRSYNEDDGAAQYDYFLITNSTLEGLGFDFEKHQYAIDNRLNTVIIENKNRKIKSWLLSGLRDEVISEEDYNELLRKFTIN